MSAGVTRQDLFYAHRLGYRTCRIPGLAITPGGAVLAYCEARRDRGSDWDDSEVLLRRSADGGRTWSAPLAVASYAWHGHGPTNNPVCLCDQTTGVVHLLYCHNYARVFQCVSADDGVSWSPPREITHALTALRSVYDWGVVALGPGHGIQLANGRLLTPIWASSSHTRAHRPNRAGALVSDDHGATWQAAKLVPNAIPCCNEAAAVQLADGRVMLNMRNLDAAMRRAITVSTAEGEWATPWLDAALVEPRCFGSLARHSLPSGGRPGRILFVNPDNLTTAGAPRPWGHADRRRLTVQISYDEAHTWPVKRVLEPGLAGYADLTVLPDGQVLCLYERGPAEGSQYATLALTLARFGLDWLEEQD